MQHAVESDDPAGESEGAVADGQAGMVVPAGGCLWRHVPERTDPKTGLTIPGHKEKITDCLVTVRAAEKTDRGFEFAMELLRPDGSIYRSSLAAKTLEKCADLNAWALSTSMSNWNLTQPQRIALKRYLFLQKGAQSFIYAPGSSGFLPEFGIFLAMNNSVDADGTFIGQGPSGTFSLKCKDNLVREFRVDHLQNAPNLRQVDSRLQADALLDSNVELNAVSRRDAWLEATDDIQRFCEKLRANLTFHSGTIGLGWMVANMFFPEVQRAEAMFPILYVYGEKHSGKDTLAGMLMDAVGLKHIKAVPANKGTNPKALRNMADQVAGFPLWINEMRAQDPECDWMLAQIRTWFDGQGGAVATVDHRTKTFSIRRGLILSGQSVAGADAEMSRYVVLRLRKKDVVKEARTAVDEAMPGLKQAFQTLMSFRNELAPGFPGRVLDATQWLYRAEYTVMGKSIRLAPESRQAVCWATVLAGISLMFGQAKFDAEGIPLEIRAHIMAAMRDASEQALQEGTMGSFWEEIESQVALGMLSNRPPARWVQMNTVDGVKQVQVWTAHIKRAYTSQSKKATLASSFLRAEIESSEGYLGRKGVQMGGIIRGHVDCWDAGKNGLPEWLNDLASGKVATPEPDEETF